MQHGVLTGLDSEQEWLLKFWWEHLRRHYQGQVAFADFGMSSQARQWCQSRGVVYEVAKPLVATKDEILEKKYLFWEKSYDPQLLWKSRPSWFCKPIALVKTPFEKTLWLDLDCEVLKPLNELFTNFALPHQIALAKEPLSTKQFLVNQPGITDSYLLFNSGVILYVKSSPCIQAWQQLALMQSHLWMGDQDVLNHLINQNSFQIDLLDPKFNWRTVQGYNREAAIIHWVGSFGKSQLRKRINF